MTALIDFLPFAALLAVTGVAAGLLAGLLGLGGGIVMVPVLFFIFQAMGVGSLEAMSMATGTSLAGMIPTAISSVRAHHRKGNVDVGIFRTWWVFILIGVISGSVLVTQFRSRWFVVLFALIAMFVAVRMFLHKTGAVQELPRMIWQRISGFMLGFLSVMSGLGGGTIGVPLLSRFHVPAHRAVGTAAAFGLVIAIPGALVMLLLGKSPADAPLGTLGLVNLPALLTMVPLSILFAPVGVKLGARLPAQQLKKVFAVVLAITGVRMLLSALGI